MDLYQVRACIRGANSALQSLSRVQNHTGDEKGSIRDASTENSNGYKGASSPNVNEKLSENSRDVSSQLDELGSHIRSIQSIKRDLEYLERRLEEEERARWSR